MASGSASTEFAPSKIEKPIIESPFEVVSTDSDYTDIATELDALRQIVKSQTEQIANLNERLRALE